MLGLALGCSRRWIWLALIFAGLLVCSSSLVIAQVPGDEFVVDPLGVPGQPGIEPPDGAQAFAPGQQYIKFEILSLVQMSYTRHPFPQIAGLAHYEDAIAAGNFSSIGTPTTARDESLLPKLVHSLPPFAVEVGTTVDWVFPRTVSAGFDYTRISQTDEEALGEVTDPNSLDPIIVMDSYYYAGYVRAYAFNAEEPGLNYYLGLGWGLLAGKFHTTELGVENTASFQQAPFGFQQLGLELMGDTFGFRYEIRLINADRVRLSENPLVDGSGETKINFSGTMTRLSLLYLF